MKDLSLIEIIENIQSNKTTSKEVWDYFMGRIEKYDAKMNVVSSITAQYAKNFTGDDRWEAKNNVIAVNLKGDTLKTEYLVWDTRKKKIYSDQFVKIIQKDQIYTGIGFESDQDFSSYHIKNLKGNMYVNVDE